MITARLTKRCNIQTASPTAGRTTVISSLPCSAIYPADRQAKERAGQAAEAQSMIAYCSANAAGTIEPGMRLVLGLVDLRIANVNPWPADDPKFLELLCEAVS